MTLTPTSWVRRWVAARLVSTTASRPGGLSAVSVVPKRLTMPLRRDGLEPVPALGRKRATAPVSRIGRMLGINVWLVTGYEPARAVLNDTVSYSTDIRPYLGGADPQGSIGGLGFTDPPEHTRLRKLLTAEFTTRRLARLAPTIERIVEQRLDELVARDDVVDLVPEFAFPIPFLVICELLGLPADDREQIRELGRARFDVGGGGGGTFGAMSQSRDLLTAAIAKQREHPGDGLIGTLIKTHGEQVDDAALAGLADGVFTGGYETSASMIAMGTLALIRDRAAFELIRDNDEMLDATVDELLRYLSVVQISFPRFARRDTVVFGKEIKSGDVVVCSLSGANRDGIFGAEPERFDPQRQRRPHLAFGHGVHRCIGSELARMELRAAFRGFARRFPRAALAAEPRTLQFRDLSIVYGLRSLPVLLDASSAGPTTPPVRN